MASHAFPTEIVTAACPEIAWPAPARARADLPDIAPDGRPWPALRLLVLPGTGDAAATRAAIALQGYPGRCETVSPGAQPAVGPDPAYWLALRAGDLLAPGALAALCAEAVLTGADLVTGLDVHRGKGGVHALTALALPEGLLDWEAAQRALASGHGEGPLHGALLRADALARVGGHAGLADDPAGLWLRLAEAGARLARVGRPVLVRQGAVPVPVPAGEGPALTIAALTDLGLRGGAGIAHRRLTEALALGGYRIRHLRLADESPPAAAEWADAFPRAEAAAAGSDLVLAGNLHGATRSLAVLDRLSRSRPVALVLHDLFPLTGRCAHPKDCARIAGGCDRFCPSPEEYPALAPKRIASAHREKRRVLAEPNGPLLLAASDWAFARARDLAPPGARAARIGLAFPTGVFRPGARDALRRELGLPLEDRLVVFAAVIADAPDKGFADLVVALRRVAGPGIGFVALGRLDDPGGLSLDNLHAPGPIGDEARLRAYYAACDVHLVASRLETFGQTPIEAGLCGLPTVAYRATGLTSSVIDGVTGCLVEPGADLSVPLAALLADDARRRHLGATARLVFESRFSHAASALRFDDALARHAILSERAPRKRFAPETLGHYAFASARHPGAAGTVAPPSRALTRRLRRLKHAVLGRGMPLWLRRLLYAQALARGGLARVGLTRANLTRSRGARTGPAR